MKKYRVTFFMQNLGAGGAQRHTVSLLRGLHDKFEFSVVLQEPLVNSGIINENDNFFISSPDNFECGLSRFDRWKAAAKRISDTRPDLVLCVNQVALLVAFFGRSFGLFSSKIASIFHSTEVSNFSGLVRTFPFVIASNFSDGLFFISRNQEKIWKKKLLRAAHVWTIVNAIDSNILSNKNKNSVTRSQIGFSESDFVIGCLAVFRYEKNHIQQIEALSKLRSAGIPAKLLLIGDGPTQKNIIKKSFDLGLSDFVYFAGMQEDVASFISLMDVGWITSLSIETISLAALECMSLGVPMIMSDIGGASEIINSGHNGFIFPAGDTDALVDAAKNLFNPSLRYTMAREAERTVRLKFNISDMLQKYEDAFIFICRSNYDEK